jgi:hypothetical protein
LLAVFSAGLDFSAAGGLGSLDAPLEVDDSLEDEFVAEESEDESDLDLLA